ncbi:MAG TPA: hypothetical protein VMZ53_32575 [Kofleriaceae bacterium]|nr:hypothetical protein [Kofleriaceae bacterium]
MKLSKWLLLVPTLWVTVYCSGSLVDVDLGAVVNWTTSMLWMALGLVYIVHIWRNKSFVMTTAKRILWTLAMLGFGPIAMPLYFVFHVLPDDVAAQ